MKKIAFGIALLVMCAQAVAHDLVAVWERALPNTNTLYSTDLSEVIADPTQGAAFWMPCAGSVSGPGGIPATVPFTANFGYASPMAFTCSQPSGTVPLYRLYKGAPQTEHFYTTSLTEANTVLSGGYTFQRIEGYVFTTQVPGSLPLYRLVKCYVVVAGGCDLEHRLTLSNDTKNTLIAAGWALDGVFGYAFNGYVNPSVTTRYHGTFNGLPTSGGFFGPWANISIQNVSPPGGFLNISGNGGSASEGVLGSNTTTRPATARKQRITFDFYTGTLFDQGSSIDHIPVFLYAHIQYSSVGRGAVPYDGMGIFFAKPNWGPNRCPSANNLTSGGQIFSERMGYTISSCEANLAETGGVAPLRPNTTYRVSFTVSDDAVVSLQVVDITVKNAPPLPFTIPGSLPRSYAADYACPINPAPGSLSPSTTFCNNPYVPVGFPSSRTGYALWPIFSGTSAPGTGVGGISAIVVQWLDQNNNVVWTQ